LISIYFYNAYSGTIPGWMRTPNHSPAMIRKKARWVNAAFGTFYLGLLAISYLILKHRQHS
jgi:hypothetical protein